MTYECIILGVGGVGSAALYQLARRGAKVLGIDRFPPGHDRGSSHGRTRIIRQAYFEHADYVPLLLRAYELWAELEQLSGQRLYHEIGLLQIGPPDGFVVPGVLHSAKQYQLPVEALDAAEIRRRFPGFRVADHWQGALEQRAGYLRVEGCVLAHIAVAQRAGAELQIGETVTSWQADDQGVTVQTDKNTFHARQLIVTAGPWAGPLLNDLRVSLEVRRVPQFWFANSDPVYRDDRGCPAFLYELPQGIFYGFPEIADWGVKAAGHSGGESVSDPLFVDRQQRPEDERQIADFLKAHLPGVSPRVLHHEVCMYTMSPDEHFIVDRHPQYSRVCFAAGLSGHGFKFTSVLGEALADLAWQGSTTLPIGFLSSQRPGLS